MSEQSPYQIRWQRCFNFLLPLVTLLS